MSSPADLPPHLMPSGDMTGAISRPLPGAVIHVRIPGECQAAMVVRTNAEDPLGGSFTVDACVFVPPDKRAHDPWDKPNTRPGQVRWVNHMKNASPAEDAPLTWHYAGIECLPPIVVQAIQRQQEEVQRGEG